MGCFFVAKNRKSEQDTPGSMKSSSSFNNNEGPHAEKPPKTLSEKNSLGRSRSKDFFRVSSFLKNRSRLPPMSCRVSVSDPHLLPCPVDGSEGFSGLLASVANGGFTSSHHRTNSETLLTSRPVPLPVPHESKQKICDGSPLLQTPCLAMNAKHATHGIPLKAFKESEPQPLPLPSQVVPASSLRSFSREEILAGCQKFSPRYILRESEIGPVYRCSIKKPGSNEKLEAAVTRISSLNIEAEDEILSSMEILAQVQSPYVSKLLGVSMPKALGWSRESFEWLLVSEHVESESLQSLLRKEDRSSLDWSARMKIALGIAKGLECLHEKFQSQQCFDGYFDLFTIQVDKNFNPKLSDYSFHPFLNQNVSEVFDISMDMMVLGKSGTEKSLVRNLGKVLLALVTDKQYVEKIHFRDEEILQCVLPMLNDASNLETIIDLALRGRQMTSSVRKVVDLASQCLHESAEFRPQLHEIVEILQSVQGANNVDGSRTSKHLSRKPLEPAWATIPNLLLPRITRSRPAVRRTYELPELIELMPEEDNKIWPQEQLPVSKAQIPPQVISMNAPAATIPARGQPEKVACRPLRKHVQMPNLTCSSSFLRRDLVRDMLQASLSQTS